jgi:hypothetical protein
MPGYFSVEERHLAFNTTENYENAICNFNDGVHDRRLRTRQARGKNGR